MATNSSWDDRDFPPIVPSVKARLLKVLRHPLTSEIEVLLHAKKMLGSRAALGRSGNHFYLYAPGERKDRVLLCAHADTVWSTAGHEPILPELRISRGRVLSDHGRCGIGADDRAGIAMAIELAQLGHSVLITTGEEVGCHGARELRENPSLTEFFVEIQAHAFLVQLDRQGYGEFKCYEVGTSAFRDFITTQTGYQEPDRLHATDICELARSVCGVNFSVGYYAEHTPYEHLVLAEYQQALIDLRAFLARELPRFPLGA